MGALPKSLAARGHRVMVVAPRYGQYENVVDMGVRQNFRVFGQDVQVRAGPPGCAGPHGMRAVQLPPPPPPPAPRTLPPPRPAMHRTNPPNPRPAQVGYFHTYVDGVDYVFVQHDRYQHVNNDIYGGSREELQFRCTMLCKVRRRRGGGCWGCCGICMCSRPLQCKPGGRAGARAGTACCA